MASFLEILGGHLEVLDLPGDPAGPVVVLLHEGLGSVGLWRGFQTDVHRATGLRTVAFSRFGHGRSDPPPHPRSLSFMHDEARSTLPTLLDALRIHKPILIGHSDGASISLIFAAEHDVTGLVLIAPHVFVEDMCVTAIAELRATFEERLRDRMARHHADPGVTFHNWSNVWLDPGFGDWSLEPLLASVTVPTLLIQGRDDQYGTLAQLDSIVRGASGSVETLVVPGGHSPHLEHRESVLAAVERFVSQARASAAS